MADQAERPQYEVLIDEFVNLDNECLELIEDFTSGNVIYKCIPTDGAPDYATLFGKIVERFKGFQDYLKQLIEKRNAKLQEASNAMRSTVMAGANVVRGPDGKSTVKKYGPFEVASKTFRSFESQSLFNLLAERGLKGRLMELTTIDPKTGAPVPVVQEETKILYEPVKNWLREQNLELIIEQVYEEEEGTPAVTGPKELGWLGTTKKRGK
jgi:hypothetical protein